MRVVMEPGDLFEDADGLIWVLNVPQKGDASVGMAQLVWFGPQSDGGVPTKLGDYLTDQDLPHPESDSNTRIPIHVLNEPFRLIAELNKE